MKFKYQARTKEGEMQVGVVEAGSKDGAVNILASHNLYILKIEAEEKEGWLERLGGAFSGVKRDDMVVFTRQLATLLEARLSLNKALNTLRDQTPNEVLKEAIVEVAQDIDSGLSFSQALGRQNEIFSTFFISMVQSAEVTGNLDQTMKFLADYIEREAILVSKARSAMIYPAIVVALFLIVAFLMLTIVFPQIKPIFDESNVALPLLTQVLIAAGTFMSKYWIAVLVAFFISIFALADYARTKEGRALTDDLKVRLPVIRGVFLPITLTRFANASAMLIKGGVPIAQAMEIVGETVDNILYRDVLRDISEKLRQGNSLSQAIADYPKYFPVLVSQMIAVGEATGQIDEMFMRVSSFYGRQSDGVVNNLVELIQPILMIGIGLMVALLFAAILMPLYSLTSAF